MKTINQILTIITLGALTIGCGVENSGGDGNAGAGGDAKAKVGDKVTFDDSEWTVTSARNLGSTLTSELLDNKQSEGKFIIVEFTVKNTTNEEDSIADSPELIDDKGRKYSMGEDLTMYIPGDAKTITLEALPSGLAKKFQAIYEVPADATGLAFRARELAFSPDYKPIDLGLDSAAPSPGGKGNKLPDPPATNAPSKK